MKTRMISKIALPWRVLMSVGAGMLFLLLLCLVAAAIAFHSDSPLSHVGMLGAAATLLTLFFCAFFGARVISENRFAGGLLCGALVWLLLLCGSFFTEQNFFHTALLSGIGFAAVAAGALLGAREKQRRHRRR